jgi:hypothetical protein
LDNSVYYGRTVTVSGLDRPNYKSVIAARVNAANNFGGTYVSFKGGNGRVTKTYDQAIFPPPNLHYTIIVDGFLGDINDVQDVGVGSVTASNGALGQFSKRAIAKISPFSGGVFLGELREAIHMIRNPAKALFDQIRSYAYGAKKLRKRIGKEKWKKVAAGLWLESVYGWLPLISDVKSGARAVSRVVNDFRPNEYVSSDEVSDATQIQPTTLKSRSWDNASWYYYQDITEVSSYKVVGAVRIDPASTLRGSLDVFGISWDQVLPTAWELLPFSFVTDYFSNVGDVIASASILNGRVVWISGSTKIVRRVRQDGFTAIQGGQLNQSCSASAGQFNATITRYARSPIASAVPSLQFECPGLKSMKWLNLTALATALSS